MRRIMDEMRSVIAERSEAIGEGDPAAMRARFAEDARRWNRNPPALPKVEDYQLPVDGTKISVRVYYPEITDDAMPAFLYFHGGGWIVGDLDSNDSMIRHLALESGVIAVSVDYRLAPEHRFPVPLDDCILATLWVVNNSASLGIDEQRLALCGDSAGANLALAAANDLVQEHSLKLSLCLLIYGAYDTDFDKPSYLRFGSDFSGFAREAMRTFWKHYLGNNTGQTDDTRAAPLKADFTGFPPVLLQSGDIDPLVDDSRYLHRTLLRFGVESRLLEYKGVGHGFVTMHDEIDAGRRALTDAAAALREALSR